MEAWIFMKFETSVHKIVIDYQKFFHKDRCIDACDLVANSRAHVLSRVEKTFLSEKYVLRFVSFLGPQLYFGFPGFFSYTVWMFSWPNLVCKDIGQGRSISNIWYITSRRLVSNNYFYLIDYYNGWKRLISME